MATKRGRATTRGKNPAAEPDKVETVTLADLGKTELGKANAKSWDAVTKPKRRRRRSKLQALATRTIGDIKRKERQFLREVSAILTEALGFPVRVSHVKVPATVPMTPRMNRFARLPKREAHRQIMESFAPLDDALPI
jgi:hypothetical protein